jgi:hypothetical protein
VARVLGLGLRTQMAVDLALLSGLAAALIAAARRLRGSTRAADAFFPLVLLSVGQHENLLWAVQVNFVLPVCLQGAALVLVAGAGEQLSVRRATAAGCCAVALPLCGMQGLVIGATLAAWLTYAGWRGGRAAVVAAGFALATAGVVVAYRVGYQPPVHETAPRLDAGAARYALRMLAVGWGPAAEELTPDEPTPWPSPVGVATLALLGLTIVRLVRAARDPRDRLAATGLLTLLAGLLVLAGGIAYGRAAFSGGAVVNRYVTLMAPALCGCYLAWVRFGPPPAAGVIAGGMFLAAVAFAWPNAQAGLTAGRDKLLVHSSIERDVYRGVPASVLAEQYGWFLFPFDHGQVPPAFAALRDRGVSPFHRLAAEPRLREVPATWRVEASPAAGADGWCRAGDVQTILLTVTVRSAERVTGVRLRYSLVGESNRVGGEAYWRWPVPTGGEWPMLLPQALEPGDGREKRLWLGEGTAGFTLVAHGPRVAVRVERVTAFVAE